VDDTPDDVLDDGSGVIGATPEFAVVVDDADVLDDAVAGCAASGGVSVGPLKFSGSWPCSIAVTHGRVRGNREGRLLKVRVA